MRLPKAFGIVPLILSMSVLPVGTKASQPGPQVAGNPGRPFSIWLTPDGGIYGHTFGAGLNLQFAGSNGLTGGLKITAGQELCILCDHHPEKFYTHALSVGYRGTSPVGVISGSIGPNWGLGERTLPGATAEPDSVWDSSCSLFCRGNLPPKENYRGFGWQASIQWAFANRYAGIGVDTHLVSIHGRMLPGVSLIVPLGFIK
jgi:hypothetical protein